MAILEKHDFIYIYILFSSFKLASTEREMGILSLSSQHETFQELTFILQYFYRAEAYFGRGGEAPGTVLMFAL